MTSTETFSLMARLTAEDRAELECRYDGPIPVEAVRAKLAFYQAEDEAAELRAKAARKFDGAKNWLRKGNRDAAAYRRAGNPEMARMIRQQYRDMARDLLEERAAIIASLRAAELRMAAE